MAFNKVILIGNMTADPELKQTQSGLSVCSFSIAVNRPKSKDGEQNCDFLNIQAWRQTAEFVAKYFKKGQAILVCGALQTRTWTDNQGNKRNAVEVVADEVSFVGGKESPTDAKSQTSAYVPSAYHSYHPQFEEVTNNGDLPF
jgi:single-strand DNA-binding protein